MKKSTVKLLVTLMTVVLLATGCTKDKGGEGSTGDASASPTPTEKIYGSGGGGSASNTFKPEQLPLKNSDTNESSAASVEISPDDAEEVTTIGDINDATFDEAESISDVSWGKLGGSVNMSITEDGFRGNCLYYTKEADASASFHTPTLDISKYFTRGGTYTIRFKVKVIGSDGTKSAFAGVIRTDSVVSFTPERANGQTYAGTGTSGPLEDEIWYLYTGQITIADSDIGKGGKWKLGLQSIQADIESIWLDEIEIFETPFEAEVTHVTSAKTWVANEVTLISSKRYDDPFNDVDMDLILTNGEVTYTIPGFWDGGNIWRARFVCPSIGTWTYTTKCSDTTNTGLHNQTSTVQCTKYNGNLPVYLHGFVKTEPNTKYFVYDDGTPFFYLGDTHWALGGETYDMVKTIVDTRAKQGYTVFQSEPINASFDCRDSISTEDIKGFRDYDKKFEYIASYGMVHTNASLFFTSYMSEFIAANGGYSDKIVSVDLHYKGGKMNMYDLADETKETLEKMVRYWVARYSAYPVMWTLAQECDNDYFWNQFVDYKGHKEWSGVNNPYKYVAEYFYKYDPYKSPITAHQEGSSMTTATSSSFRNVEGHTWWASQWKPSVTGEKEVLLRAQDYWNNGQGKPAVTYESYYCMLQTEHFGARAQGWMSYLSGMFGYGYGAQGTWYYQGSYHADEVSTDGVDDITPEEKAAQTWKGALEFESAMQSTYIRYFFENIVVDWHTLIPRFLSSEYLQCDNGAYAVFASNEDNSKFVAYFYNFSDPSLAERVNSASAGTKTGVVSKLTPNAAYKYMWFDPINGTVAHEGTFTASADGTWAIGEKAATDMVLYIYK